MKSQAGPTFAEFFQSATSCTPYGYQARAAAGGLPAVVQAPTGAGKTGIVLAWLWRRLHGPDQAGTPRRLIYALPQRSLVEQVARDAERWLENLGLTGQVALHVVMGGEGATQRQWRLDMQQPAIVVGTVNSLVSKALNRGYGMAGRPTRSTSRWSLTVRSGSSMRSSCAPSRSRPCGNWPRSLPRWVRRSRSP